MCKMLLCIGSVLTNCICADSQTDTIAGLLKSDFLGPWRATDLKCWLSVPFFWYHKGSGLWICRSLPWSTYLYTYISDIVYPTIVRIMKHIVWEKYTAHIVSDGSIVYRND